MELSKTQTIIYMIKKTRKKNVARNSKKPLSKANKKIVKPFVPTVPEKLPITFSNWQQLKNFLFPSHDK